MTTPDLGAAVLHFLMLSMLAVGGAISTAPDMHRYLVDEQGWMSDGQFGSSIALAQVAPGPNVLFVAVLGWNLAGWSGALALLAASVLPSTTLAVLAGRWRRRHQDALGLRLFSAGMPPLAVGLVLSTGWLLAQPAQGHGPALALVLVTAVAMVRTKSSPLWWIALGALVGAAGGA